MKKPQQLFLVTLDWNRYNQELGDYATTVWAADEKEAIRLVAEEMAEHEDSGCETDAERAEFVANRIAEAGQFAAELVGASLPNKIRELLAGPRSKMTKKAERHYERILALLAVYGVTP
jgi:hypothetical protein